MIPNYINNEDNHQKYLLQIELDKYPLLKKLDPDYLNVMMLDMFNNGYNQFVRNNISNQNNILNQTLNENNITENKTTAKGQLGENIVYDILIEKFQDHCIENTARIPHSGDFQITLKNHHKIMLEVKNYNKTVDQTELDKMRFDQFD